MFFFTSLLVLCSLSQFSDELQDETGVMWSLLGSVARRVVVVLCGVCGAGARAQRRLHVLQVPVTVHGTLGDGGPPQ